MNISKGFFSRNDSTLHGFITIHRIVNTAYVFTISITQSICFQPFILTAKKLKKY